MPTINRILDCNCDIYGNLTFLSGASTADITVNGLTLGRGAGSQITNVATGNLALAVNTTGFSNTANGYQALAANTIGVQNTANGSVALTGNVDGSYNVANGFQTLSNNISGVYNLGSGYQALLSNTGHQNTGVGALALNNNTSGALNVGLGYGSNCPSATASGQLSIQNIIYGFANTGTGATVSAGRIAIGKNTDDGISRFQLAAGSTAGPPLSVASGTLATTPTAGAVEYNGNWYLTDSTATRRSITSDYVCVLDRIVATTTVANTITLTDIYTKAVSHDDINGHALRLTIGGTYTNNTGANQTLALRVTINGVSYYRDTSLAIPTSANVRAWRIELLLTSRSTTAQSSTGLFAISDSAALVGAGAGAISVAQLIHVPIQFDSTEATSGAGTKSVNVKIAHSAASASLSISLTSAVLERL